MGKKTNLPVLGTPAPKKPSIDAARARLGGRAEGDPSAAGLTPGQIVTFGATGHAKTPAVVLYVGKGEIHVLIDPLRLRRLPPAQLEIHDGPLPDGLAKLAADARLFGMLAEGQPIRYADEGGALIDGKLIEKCRWGALVARGDGAVVAVGFRKLWPAPHAGGLDA